MKERTFPVFLLGLGVGVGIGCCFAPKSGQENGARSLRTRPKKDPGNISRGEISSRAVGDQGLRLSARKSRGRHLLTDARS